MGLLARFVQVFQILWLQKLYLKEMQFHMQWKGIISFTSFSVAFPRRKAT
jgi:hypothetical protein